MFTYEQVLAIIEAQIANGQQQMALGRLIEADNILDICQNWLALLIMLDSNAHLANSIAVNERIVGLRKQIKEKRAAIAPAELSDNDRS